MSGIHDIDEYIAWIIASMVFGVCLCLFGYALFGPALVAWWKRFGVSFCSSGAVAIVVFAYGIDLHHQPLVEMRFWVLFGAALAANEVVWLVAKCRCAQGWGQGDEDG